MSALQRFRTALTSRALSARPILNLSCRFASSTRPNPPPTATNTARPPAHTARQTDPPAAGVTPAAPPTPVQPLPPLHFAPPTPEQLHALRLRLSGPSARSASVPRGRSSLLLPPRVLCLDVGDRYIGVALSSEDNECAHPLLTMHRKEIAATPDKQQPVSVHSHHTAHRVKTHVDLRGPAASSRRSLVPRPLSLLAAELRSLIDRHHCVSVVVGLPLTLEYTLDAQCVKTMQFVQDMHSEWSKVPRNAAEAQRLMQQAHANMMAAEAELINQGKRKKSAMPPASSKPATTVSSSSPPLPAFVPPPFLWWDERLSSVDARAQLEARGVKNRSVAMAQQTDALAAAVVLQELLDRLRSS